MLIQMNLYLSLFKLISFRYLILQILFSFKYLILQIFPLI